MGAIQDPTGASRAMWAVQRAMGAGGVQGVQETAAGGPSFADTLKQVIGEVSELQEGAHDSIQAFLRGEPVELHQVMAAVEEAGIALDLLIEIRNRLTEAYRTVTSMQN